ncbi:type II toxin-antitoxin system RelE/ParE family toxin [bacterium]|nr:type II toxin-antitoxin system RelE/ParE family toxin [bacterium]
MSLHWTAESLERLAEIEDFIARDSPERAVRFIELIIDHATELLPNNPQAGRVVPEIARPDIRELIFKGYRIVYQVKPDKIEILSVFEGHRLLRGSDLQ